MIAPTSQRHHGLDAARGICACAVAAYHFMAWSGLASPVSMSMFSVYAFFTLSSLTLCIVYGERFSRSIEAISLERYALNRAARILPLLALVSALTSLNTLLRGQPTGGDIASFFFTASGIMGFGPAGMLANATGAWSLGVEILFYFLFPCACLLLLHQSITVSVLVTLGALTAQCAFLQTLLSDTSLVKQWYLFVSPLSFAYYFCVGFLIYKTKKPVTGGLYIGLALLSAVILFSTTWHLTPETLLSFPLSIILPTIVGTAIWLIFNGDVASPLTRGFEFLGAISYSIYLLHPLVYMVLDYAAHRTAAPFWLFAIIFGMLVIVTGYASYRLVEIPARNWIRHLMP